MGINMIALTKTAGSRVSKTYRILKVQVFGKSDVREGQQSAPYGLDNNPVDGGIAVYADTAINGQPVILGYINPNQLAAVGESRLYATDSDGVFKCNVWMQANGDILIGDSNAPAAYTEFFVKHTALNTALQTMLVTVNSNFTALYTLLGTPAPPVTINIALAKTTKIKTT